VALQGAWSAIVRTTGLVDGLQAAVRGGGDTDTVAAIAGGLLGAAYGASAVSSAAADRRVPLPDISLKITKGVT
jgi:ADP-ribosylglycohydrolase